MSRCFPYPPPGYEKNGIRDQALIESIKKLQKEGEKAKKEKKEKKREKKEKDKIRENGETEKTKHRHRKVKRHRDEKEQEGQKIRDHSKKRKFESEILEKSNLTEEHGQPVDSQNSFDSTLNNNNINNNNNNNKRLKPSLTHESCHNTGSIIRIRLPLQRHKDPEMSLPSKVQPCPASGRIGDKAFVQRPCETPLLERGREQVEQHPQPCSSSGNPSREIKVLGLAKDESKRSSKPIAISVPGEEKHNRSSKPADISRRVSAFPVPSKEKPLDTSCRDFTTVSVPGKEKPKPIETIPTTSKENHRHSSKKPADICQTVEPSPKIGKSSSRKSRSVSKFNDLFENWVPPPMQVDSIDSGDEKWLFETKRKPVEDFEVSKEDNESFEPSSFWPRAHFLPAADIFALPYAVPF